MNMDTKEIKILEVVDNYFPIIDGVVNVTDNYCRLLNKTEGAICDALVPWYPKSYDGGGYKVIRTLSVSGGKYGVRLPLPMLDLRLKKYLKKNHYDIVHCHSPVTLARTMLKYCKKNNIPIVFTVHTKYHEEINRSVKIKFLQKFALNFILRPIRKMDYIWAVSKGSAECLKNVYHIDLPTEIVKNGTDLHSVAKADAAALSKEIKDKYNIRQDEKVFLFVGRLVVVKNISLVLKTVELLKKRGMSLRLLIVGDGDYRETLERETKTLSIDDITIFTGEITDRSKLSGYYLAADYFLFPSEFDTFSLSSKEAAVMNTPSLLVKDSFSSEGITDMVNGFTEIPDPEAWADKIEYIEKNPDVYAKVSENCPAICSSWEEVIDIVFQKYKDIIEKGKPKNMRH